jgi:protein O-GlcNAc transferase
MKPGKVFEVALRRQRGGRFDEAERLYREVLRHDPNHREALVQLGDLLLQSGRIPSAVQLLERATSAHPRDPALHAQLGEALRRAGQVTSALESLEKALTLKPDDPAALLSVGLVFRVLGAQERALTALERASALRPGSVEAEYHLAGALRESGQLEKAVEHYLRAATLGPHLVEVLVDTAGALRAARRLDEAIDMYRQALRIKAGFALAHNNLGVALMDTGNVDEAVTCYRQALAIQPDFALARSNLVYALMFHPQDDGRPVVEEARAWQRQHADRLATTVKAHRNDRSPERALRIGYVSPDFRDHCQAFFMTPLLRHHDRERFKVVCYSSVLEPDAMTHRLRAHADEWRDIARTDDHAASQQVRDDGIDILVDLTMHMTNGRLPLFARKPAPIQVCWLAYPGTTGIKAMDYRITDPLLDPPELGADLYTEQSIRLPASFWCYDPLIEGALEVGPLPASRNGYVTFGCQNNFKVHDGVLALWSRVLRAVDGSRLLLLAPSGRTRQKTVRAFESFGVDPTRIRFVGFRPRREYLEAYREIDVCLDTFPYNGHTTSLDAHWMGVPVVTYVGRTVVGRAGLSIATHLGLPELIAHSADDYVLRAVELSADLRQLATLRRGLRSRMEASPLMDAPRFARGLEAGYREMWRAWCTGPAPAQ